MNRFLLISLIGVSSLAVKAAPLGCLNAEAKRQGVLTEFRDLKAGRGLVDDAGAERYSRQVLALQSRYFDIRNYIMACGCAYRQFWLSSPEVIQAWKDTHPKLPADCRP